MTTSSSWPLVVEHDDGFRPAGRPDTCFYCGRRLGQLHATDCVVVTKVVAMRVTAKLPDGRIVIGMWQHRVPHFWEAADCEFSKNESTWCASNLLRCRDDVVWAGTDPWDALDAMYEGGNCLCDGTLMFDFMHVVDGSPYRALRVPESKVN